MNGFPNSYGPGNPYGNNPVYSDYGYGQFYDYEKKKRDKRNIRKLGLYAGAALILYIIVQYAMVLLLEVFASVELYTENELFQCAFDIILTIFGMYLPFAFMGKKMQKISRIPDPVPLGKPESPFITFLAVVAGLGLCMIANYVTSFITVFMSVFGFKLSSPDLAMPTGILGVTLTVARIAVVAAVVEELSHRGYVMGNLRKYGDVFAITMSAFVFAFMHGNLIQAPFALVAGFGLGYFSVKTNSLWTGIIIHFCNNLISVSVSYLTDIVDENILNAIYGCLIFVLIGCGILCFVVFNSKTKHIVLKKNQTSLSTGECVVNFLFSPTMIVSMIYMLYVTATFIQKNTAG